MSIFKRDRKRKFAEALSISALLGVTSPAVPLQAAGLDYSRETVSYSLQEEPETAATATEQIRVTVVAGSGGYATPSSSIPKGTSITLHASPSEGYQFSCWKQDETVVSYSSEYVTGALETDVIYEAVFEKKEAGTRLITAETMLYENGNRQITYECGTVYGSREIGEDEVVTLQAESTIPELYRFKHWLATQDGSTYYEAGQNPTLKVARREGVGGDYVLDDDEELFASFEWTGNVIVTGTMVPGIGGVHFTSGAKLTDDEVTLTENMLTYHSSASILAGSSDNVYFYSWAKTPLTSSHDFGGDTSPKQEYSFIDMEYVTSDGQRGIVNSSIRGNNERMHESDDLNSLIASGAKRIDLFAKYEGYDSAFNYTNSLSTVAIPADGGTTAGDMSSATGFTTNIRATPAQGFEFDHWEWTDQETGKPKTSTDPQLMVSVSGFVCYKAFFHPKTWEVKVATVNPEGGGYVVEGLGEHKDSEDVKVTVQPREGYEFQSASYTTVNGIVYSHDTNTFTIPEIREDIYLNLTFRKTSFNVSAKPEPLGRNGVYYNKVKMTSGTQELSTDETGEAISMEQHSQASITLEAIPSVNNGYRFAEWIGTDGSRYTQNPFSPTAVSKDVTYIARFEKEKYHIRVYADPETYGSVQIGTDASNLSALGTLEVENGGSAYLKATPADGYVFLYWTNSAGSRLTSDVLELKNIRSDENCTAHFAGQSTITIEPTAPGFGQVQLDNNGYVAVSTIYRAEAGKTVHLSAKPADNSTYIFVKWIDRNGATVSETPEFDLTVPEGNSTYTAVFERDKFTIQVSADSLVGGKASVYLTEEETHGTSEQSHVHVHTGGSVWLKAEEAEGYKFLYWTSSTGTKYNDKVFELKDVRDDETFIAHFMGSLDITIESSPAGYGQVQLDYNGYVAGSATYKIVPGTSIHLSAKPLDNTSYRFMKWVDQNGETVSTEPEFDLMVSEVNTYTAVFERDKFTIRVQADSLVGGKANVYLTEEETHGTAEQSQVDVHTGESVWLKAEEAEGYTFLYWTSSTGTKYNEKIFELKDVRADETFTAHFLGSLDITIEPSPAGYGQVQLDNNGYVSATATYKVVKDTTIHLSAKPSDNSSFRFRKWIDRNGTTVSTEPEFDVKVSESNTYTAVFDADRFTVNTIADPLDGGTANVYPADDVSDSQQTSASVHLGGSVILKAKPAEGYSFLYWTSSLGTRYNDAETRIDNIGNNETFTAHFYRDDIQVTIDSTPKGAGLVQLNQNGYVSERTTYSVAGGSNISLTAEPSDPSRYEFIAWQDNFGNTYNVNPLQITEVKQDITYTALFNPKDQEIAIVLKVSPAGAGSLHKKVNADGTVLISTEPEPGFIFRGWFYQGVIVSAERAYLVPKITDGAVFTAMYDRDPNYKPTSDIPSQSYPDQTRRYTAPNYSFTRDSLTSRVIGQIAADAARYPDFTGVPNSYRAYQSTIEQTSGNYVDENDRSALLMNEELVTTEKQVLKTTVSAIQNADEVVQQFVEKKYGSRYRHTILTSMFIPADCGIGEGSHTFLLKYSGAAYRDNVFILYGGQGSSRKNSGISGYDWVSGVVDEEETIRFTIPSFRSGENIIVVKTWPE
ncbi:MAG: hypothetical protein IKS32_01970 [Solobacterium sp.]|nr:hypothetical protein [Solobacterium sp.]